MRNQLRLLLVAAISASAIGMAGCNREEADKSKTTGQKAGDAVQSAVDNTTKAAKDAKDTVVANVAPSGSADVSGIRSTLSAVVTNALGADDFKKMTGYFVDADQKRVEPASANVADLNSTIGQFNQLWKQKYNSSFSVDKDKVYGSPFVTLTSADMPDKTRTGKAAIAASHGMAALDVPVVAQDGSWRIDLPDTVTPTMLHDKLLAAVQGLNKAVDQWPADPVEAGQVVSHHILTAVMGQ